MDREDDREEMKDPGYENKLYIYIQTSNYFAYDSSH